MDEIKKILIPYDTSFSKKRYGKKNDGGYVLYEQLVDVCDCVYSFGINNDYSFEEDIYKQKKTNLYMYDGTVDHYFENKDFNFIKKNVDSVVFKEINQSFQNIILKSDIEGSEYEMFLNCDDKYLKIFSQICFELHDIHSNRDAAKLLLNKINNFYTLFHIHGNNYSYIKDEIPNVLELSFVNNNLILDKNISIQEYPSHLLDSPNDPLRNDYILNWWK